MIQLSLTVSVLDKTPLDEAAKRKLRAKEIKNLVILKKSVDARKKEDVRYVYSVAMTTENDKKYLSKEVAPYAPTGNSTYPSTSVTTRVN